MPTDAATPLEGLRVIELSTTPVAARIGQVLADSGAEVIQVEPPGGSSNRTIPGYPAWGRGKRSIVLDLHDGTDQDVAAKLIRGADVLVETMRPGVAERLGLGYADMSKANPRLVYASVTAFPRTSALAHAPGYEHLVMAKLGAMHTFAGMIDRPGPAYVATPFCSAPAAQHALQGILAALYERDSSGAGQHVEATLAQGFSSLDTWSLSTAVVAQRWPEAFTPMKAFADDGSPMTPMLYSLIISPSSDGTWLQFAQVQPRLFLAFLRALGLESILTDPYWAGIPHFEDKKRRVELWDLLVSACHQLDMRSWEDVFARDTDVFAEVFRDGAEVLRHPQLVAFDQVIEIEDPVLGTVSQLAPAIRIGAGVRLTRSAPVLDADGTALRQEPARPSAPPAPAAPMTGAKPLEGVTVLELGILFAGPFGATLLADLGATVIKVESLEGDPIRNMAAFPESGGIHVLQGKKSIAVDFTKEDGCRIVKELAARSDIVLQSFRPGAVERHGLDVASLREVNPQLVYLDALAYGRTGPQALRPAFAPSIGAAAGIAMRNVHRADYVRNDLSLEEIKSSARRLNTAGTTSQAQADGLSGNVVATGLLLGLLARKRSGAGVDLCTTMLASTAHALSDDVIDYVDRPALPTTDHDLLGLGALYRLYEGREGWIFLAAPQPGEWAELVKALTSFGFEEDDRFSTAEGRTAHDAALAEALAATFRCRTAVEWEAALLPSGVGCVAVAEQDPEHQWLGDFGREGNYVVDVEHETFETHPRAVPNVRFSRSDTSAGPSPLAGAHTEELLAWLGYADADVSRLRSSGVVA